MAVLVRPAGTEAATQRIDALLARWENETGHALPRPVVFEGDLCRTDLGLSTSDQQWLRRHCRAVVHSAAKLTFYGTDRRREPWLSNVEGTQQVLELCRRCGIRQFHYVSTAYVCGLREGRILETELDVGQEMGNDYERSKVQAEQLVRSADLGYPPTIYRPSILIGDSQTGYTSTFHGFYAMVHLVHTLASQVVRGSITPTLLLETLGLEGHERKNYVPVDWVSTIITHLLSRPSHHGRTYHLTAGESTPLAVSSQVIQDAVEKYSPLADPADLTNRDAAWFVEMFRGQAEIYRAYWRDDPQFDRTHTVAAAAHLPCPSVDYKMLMHMARFAIQTNFGRRCPRCKPPNRDIRRHMQRLLSARDLPAAEGRQPMHVGLDVKGHGGGQWKLLARDRQVVAAEDGIGERCETVFQLTSDTFSRLAAREISVSQAVREGRVVIAGEGMQPSSLEALFQTVVTPEND
jgi:thioester reductase-like protein